MHVGVPKSTTLTVTNISGNSVSITPSVDFGIKSDGFLESKLEFCNSGKCSPVNRSTKINIPKGGHQELVVTVVLTGDATQDTRSFSVAGDLKVIGEVLRK